MHLHTVTSILIAAAGFCQSQAATTIVAADKPNHWCGRWAGSPRPADAPVSGQLPGPDYTRRFFAEPQLQRVPFSPIVATEPKVQIPKIWGNHDFRLALISYAEPITSSQKRVYATSKSRWADFTGALELLMETCVSKGVGGAYLVPPSPGLTQGTLVVYAYAVNSYFDYQMNYYMTSPYGLDPGAIQASFAAANGNLTAPAVDLMAPATDVVSAE